MPGFRPVDGWVHRGWTKTATLNVKNKPVTATHKRNYLINNNTGAVITANGKAWMDSITVRSLVLPPVSPPSQHVLFPPRYHAQLGPLGCHIM